jgi:hypothetical protein
MYCLDVKSADLHFKATLFSDIVVMYISLFSLLLYVHFFIQFTVLSIRLSQLVVLMQFLCWNLLEQTVLLIIHTLRQRSRSGKRASECYMPV